MAMLDIVQPKNDDTDEDATNADVLPHKKYAQNRPIITRVMFRPKIKLDVFFHQKSCRWALGGGEVFTEFSFGIG